MKRFSMIAPLLLLFILMPILGFAQQGSQTQAPESAAAPSQGPTAHGERGHDPSHHGESEGGHAGQHGHDMDKCKEMMAKHDQYKAEWQAMDERMKAKIDSMNAAKGDKKMEAMAAVINEMADQRSRMREMFMASHGKGCPGMAGGSHGGMMGGRMGMMGGHGGQNTGGSGGMCPNCPMMKGHGSGQDGGTTASGGQEQQAGSQ